MKCGLNQVYIFNAMVCQPTCTNRRPKCTDREEGCICRSGFVLSGDKCVPVSKCGCQHNGIYMVVSKAERFKQIQCYNFRYLYI